MIRALRRLSTGTSVRGWSRSLYWRLAAGFVAFLAVTLVVQAAFLVWFVVRGERDVPARSLVLFASMVARDLAVDFDPDDLAGVERQLADRYGSIPRPIWVVTPDGRATDGPWGTAPANLVRRAGERQARGAPPGLDMREFRRSRRLAAFAPVVSRGRVVATVVVMAGRPPGVVIQQFGPWLVIVAIGLVGAGILTSVIVFRPANRRLQALADAARRLGAGQTSVRALEAGGDEIAGVARAFNQMADALAQRAEALQASDRVRRQLLADVSHELMTPLTAIRGYLETLDMPSIALDDATRGRYLAIVREETQRLEQVVGDLLDLARLEAGGGTLSIDDLPVGQLLARVLARHERTAVDHGIALTASGDLEILVRGDRLRLEQALQNLAANALRHTPAGGCVDLMAQRRDGAIVLIVRDTGEGIDPAHLPHVFDRFYKTDASRAEASRTGSGLGLSIVKAIVERHGGRVSVASEPGHGTTFEIVLPDGEPRGGPAHETTSG